MVDPGETPVRFQQRIERLEEGSDGKQVSKVRGRGAHRVRELQGALPRDALQCPSRTSA